MPFAPDSVGVNTGIKVPLTSGGLSGATTQRALQAIPKPLVGIYRFLAINNGELKIAITSSYRIDGTFIPFSGSGFLVFLLSIVGKPLTKELEGLYKANLIPTAWRTSPLVVQGFIDKATNKLITTNNSI